jgi:hypothetical protein
MRVYVQDNDRCHNKREAAVVLLNRFRAFHVLHLADQGLRSTDQGHSRHAMLRVQE